jgi:DNA-binding GntR family transcriptional regulator
VKEVTVDQTVLPIPVDRNSPIPLYFQVAQHLERMIESGELAAGTRLENEIDLADRLSLSRPTMRRAIGYLVDRGLLVRKRGVGTQVVHAKVRRQVELTSLYDDLAKTGRKPGTRVLSFGIEPVPDPVARELNLAEGTAVYAFERLRYAEDEPLALMQNYVPASLLKLSAEDLEVQGLYTLLRASGINPRIARQSIGARVSTAAQARALGETRGAPLLTMVREAYDDQDRAVEYGSHIYRASRYSFDLTLTSWLDPGGFGGVDQVLRRQPEAFERAEFGVLVFDVDGHAGVDRRQRQQEPGPELLVVTAADGDELPGGVRGPAVQRVAAADGQRVRVGRHPLEAVVEDAVDAAVLLVDAGVLGGRVIDQITQVPDRRDGVDALPEQVAGIQFGPDVGGVDLGGQPLHRGRVEDEVVRMHLDAHLDVRVARP